MTFSDSNEVHRTPVATLPVSEIISNADPQSLESALKLPPKPPAKTGVDRIAELQAIRNEYNEVTVEDEGSVNDYAQYCSILLNVCVLMITHSQSHFIVGAGRCGTFYHCEVSRGKTCTQNSSSSRRDKANTPQNRYVHKGIPCLVSQMVGVQVYPTTRSYISMCSMIPSLRRRDLV